MAPIKDVERIAAQLYCLSVLEEEVGKLTKVTLTAFKSSPLDRYYFI